MERFELRYVMGHIEVYDENGRFCFSADHVSEAMEELREEGLSQILCKHRNAVQIEQNLFKAEVAQAAAALFSK